MSFRIRPLQDADLTSLAPLDALYAAAHGLEPACSLASLRFFERSGHSFVAEGEGEAAAGFVLAQAVWSGERPTVQGVRLAVAPEAAAPARSGLVKALVKSAYDSGVYDVSFRAPASDEELLAALAGEGYLQDDHVTMQLVLGSRAQGWADGRRG